MPMEPPGGISERILAQDAPRAQLPHPARTRSTARPHTRAGRAARRDRAIRPGLRPRQRRQPVRRHARAGIPGPLPGRGLPGVASCDNDSGGSSRRRIRGGASIRATCSTWPPSPRSAFTVPAKPSTTARAPTAASSSWRSWPSCTGSSCTAKLRSSGLAAVHPVARMTRDGVASESETCVDTGGAPDAAAV